MFETKHNFQSVVEELIEGLENGTVTTEASPAEHSHEPVPDFEPASIQQRPTERHEALEHLQSAIDQCLATALALDASGLEKAINGLRQARDAVRDKEIHLNSRPGT
jgi:hypothetical protein